MAYYPIYIIYGFYCPLDPTIPSDCGAMPAHEHRIGRCILHIGCCLDIATATAAHVGCLSLEVEHGWLRNPILNMYIYIYWLLVLTILKNISQIGVLFPIYGKKMFQTTSKSDIPIIIISYISIINGVLMGTPKMSEDFSTTVGLPKGNLSAFLLGPIFDFGQQ